METKNEWLLESLNINQDWQKQGHYCGSAKFKNGIKMEMTLRLDSEAAAKMIALLQPEIVKSATQLGELIVKSMPLQIESSITGSETV